jgi:hypothetical protein
MDSVLLASDNTVYENLESVKVAIYTHARNGGRGGRVWCGIIPFIYIKINGKILKTIRNPMRNPMRSH